MNKINMESISNEYYMNRNFNVFKRLQTVTAEQASCLIVASKQIAAVILQMFRGHPSNVPAVNKIYQ